MGAVHMAQCRRTGVGSVTCDEGATRVKTRSSGAFRQWPVGLLVEIATYLLLMGVASLIALLVAGMA